MKKLKASLIITVFNEEKSIRNFINSVLSQSELPDELLIIDGGSTDDTVSEIEKIKDNENKIKIQVFVKKGNRSVGRNEAIKRARNDIILCSDAGCILDKNWIKNILTPFREKNIDVVAGYYRGKSKTIFQKCIVPYVLVMSDKVNGKEFLPATRSMAFKKSIWKKVGGFNEKLSHNEDYFFAKKLKEKNAKIAFAKDAIVEWIPRKNFKEAFVMFFRFAFGDAESGILRKKVTLIFARYALLPYFVILAIIYKSTFLLFLIVLAAVTYLIWSIKKNYKYVKNKKALLILPALQLVSDGAVLTGTFLGWVKRNIQNLNLKKAIKKNKFFFLILGFYIFVLFYLLSWGIPNLNHPFPYHMDEWHQLQAVRSTIGNGTPNVAGAANGTLFHFLLSGFYLVPFTLLGIINPIEIPIDNFVLRQNIFYLLRINTIIFGSLSIFLLYKISELVNANKKVVLFLFVVNPVWMSLSGYFKYDIVLIFWILLAIYLFAVFAKNPTNNNFLFLSIPAAIPIAVKVSAIPMLLIYIFSYFIFMPKNNRNYLYLLYGFLIFCTTVILLGMPDTLFGRGNIYDYVYTNILSDPKGASNFVLGMSPHMYLYFIQYPIVFGIANFVLFISTFLILIIKFRKFFKDRMVVLLSFAYVMFFVSLVPLSIYANSNRSLVVLPFAVLLVGIVWDSQLVNFKKKSVFRTLILLLVLLQAYQTFAWVFVKVSKSPQEASSEWIINNMPKGTVIGLENIPIYQYVPDIAQKEFYFGLYKVKNKSNFNYQIVDAKSKNLPSVIIITNGDIESRVLYSSVKRDLMHRLHNENYKEIATFKPELRFLKFFLTEKEYYFSALLVASPVSISIFQK